MVTTAYLPVALTEPLSAGSTENPAGITLPPNGVSLESVEFELARQAMVRSGGNLTHAAKLLDISRDQLRYKLKKSGEYSSLSAD